jgi:hypothetical protein
MVAHGMSAARWAGAGATGDRAPATNRRRVGDRDLVWLVAADDTADVGIVGSVVWGGLGGCHTEPGAIGPAGARTVGSNAGAVKIRPARIIRIEGDCCRRERKRGGRPRILVAHREAHGGSTAACNGERDAGQGVARAIARQVVSVAAGSSGVGASARRHHHGQACQNQLTEDSFNDRSDVSEHGGRRLQSWRQSHTTPSVAAHPAPWPASTRPNHDTIVRAAPNCHDEVL